MSHRFHSVIARARRGNSADKPHSIIGRNLSLSHMVLPEGNMSHPHLALFTPIWINTRDPGAYQYILYRHKIVEDPHRLGSVGNGEE